MDTLMDAVQPLGVLSAVGSSLIPGSWGTMLPGTEILLHKHTL